MINYISSQVARKIPSGYRTRENREWFNELEIVQAICEESFKKQYPGLIWIKFLSFYKKSM